MRNLYCDRMTGVTLKPIAASNILTAVATAPSTDVKKLGPPLRKVTIIAHSN